MFHCSINSYFTQNFIWPALMILAAIVSLFRLLFRVFHWARHQKQTSIKGNLVWVALSLFVVVTLLYHYGGIFLQRGVFLPFEKESDADMVVGIVTEIEPERHSPRYFLEGHEGTLRASFVTIDDVTYYFITADGLHPGDRIRIRFLPRSKIVLSSERDE